MIVPVALVLGVSMSVAFQNVYPLLSMLVLTCLFQEYMLYDLHRHIDEIMEKLDG